MKGKAQDFGPRPVPKWLPIGDLHVDSSYQRSIETRRSQALIATIAEKFRWSFYCAVTVVKSGKGYAVIDGQHRVEAAKRIGISELLCIVVAVQSKAEEAQAFVGANRDRVAVSPYAVHHAMVAAGAADAGAIADVCRRAGVEIPRYQIPAINLKPNQTLAIGALRGCISRLGGGATVLALETLRKAFPEPGALRAHLIVGVAAVIAARPRMPKTILQQILAAKGLAKLEGDVLQRALAGKEKRAAIVESEIVKLLPPEFARLDPRGASPISKAPIAVSANKGNAGRALMPVSRSGATAKPDPKSKRPTDDAEIAAFIAKRGVTKVPTAAVAETTAVFRSEHKPAEHGNAAWRKSSALARRKAPLTAAKTSATKRLKKAHR